MGTFDGLQIGTSGIFAARRGVDVAGQNIANINSPGYTRQRLELMADGGPAMPAIHSRWEGGGLGVRQATVTRLRDVFLDRRAREEGAVQAQLREARDTYGAIERLFNEPSDTGLGSVMADFFAAWDDVANRPTDSSARAQLAERGRTLATNIGQLKAGLENIRDVATSKLGAIVAEVNTAAQQIADLHATIQSAKASGLNPNELEDQRDALLAGLADKTGGTVHVGEDGEVTFFIGSNALVRGDSVSPIEVRTTPTTDIVWPLDGRSVPVAGQLGGLLTAANQTVPDKLAELSAFETTLANEVNALHQTAFDRNGNPGQAFFVLGPDGIEMNAAILDDPALVAVAGTAGTVDGSVGRQLAQLSGGVDAYREIVVRLGVDSLSASRRYDLQEAVVKQIDTEQESVNGVNMDEELANLVKFQHAYEANAKFISTVDQMLGVLMTLGR